MIETTRRGFLRALTGSAVGLAVGSSWDDRVEAQVVGPRILGLSGPLVHGTDITITGTGFGTKPTAAPIRYDDFLSETIGAAPSRWNTQANYSNQVTIDGTTVRHALGKSIKVDWPSPRRSGDDGASFGWTTGGTPWPRNGGVIRQCYLDFWFRMRIGSPTPANYKQIRFHQVNAGAPNFHIGTGAWSSGEAGWGTDGVDFAYHVTGGNVVGLNYPALIGAWSHMQLWVKASSTPGVANGELDILLNHVSAMPSYYTGIRTCDHPGEEWRELYLGNYNRTDEAGILSVWWGNVYVDDSRARVELGDNPVYSACAHREIQIPSAWSASSVTVTANRGSFLPGASAHLFVIDSANIASAGYPIAGGPAAPKNVIIRT